MTAFRRRGGTLAIRNALIIDGLGGEPFEGEVLIRDGVIVDEAGFEGAAADVDLDARGGAVMPGLIDAHLHAFAISLDMVRNETVRQSYLGLAAGRRLGRTLRRGFTTVRDVAGGDRGLARAIEEGLVESPRYVYAGAALSQTGGHGDATDPDSVVCLHGGLSVEVVDGADALRVAVRERLRGGAGVIKIMTSGGVISPSDPIRVPQYSGAEIEAVVEEADRRGVLVAAHAYSPEAIRHSIGHGVRSIEHGNLLDAETARAMADAGAHLVPTLAAYDAMGRRGREFGLSEVGLAKNAEVLDAGRGAIELARDAGVRIGFGSDLMGELETEQLVGLRLQAEVLGVAETILCATSGNAELLGDDRLGRIAAGAHGDVLVFEGNPLEEPELLWRDERPQVILDGVLVDAARG